VAGRKIGKRKKITKVKKAQAIIRAMVGTKNQRSRVVQRAVVNQGISVRTYRTARKQMRALAVRKGRVGGKRGKGVWYIATD
jgi:hypothetical protein